VQVTSTPQICCLIIKILFPSNFGIIYVCSLYLNILLSRIIVVANTFVLIKFIRVSYKITTFLCSLVFESLAGSGRRNWEGV
jgi:hypothetical protein